MRKIKFQPIILLTRLRDSRLWSAVRFSTTGMNLFRIGWNFEVETEVSIAFVSTLLPCNITARLYAYPNSTVELIIYTFYIVFLYPRFIFAEGE